MSGIKYKFNLNKKFATRKATFIPIKQARFNDNKFEINYTSQCIILQWQVIKPLLGREKGCVKPLFLQ